MVTIFHNPRCGKSRECLAFLNQEKEDIDVVNYLVNPPTFEELSSIIQVLRIKPIELVRQKESIWISDFKHKSMSDSEVIQAMVQHPILIERPIVINENKAVIARPYDKAKAIL
ncbi:MAG: arsenate reductase (glutaredoxin) [Flavobacterium sp.]|nr:arsenate reductase (glutaredoxin) [Flavobacterium sp.]